MLKSTKKYLPIKRQRIFGTISNACALQFMKQCVYRRIYISFDQMFALLLFFPTSTLKEETKIINVLSSSSIWTCQILNIEYLVLVTPGKCSGKSQNKYSKFNTSKLMSWRGQKIHTQNLDELFISHELESCFDCAVAWKLYQNVMLNCWKNSKNRSLQHFNEICEILHNQ